MRDTALSIGITEDRFWTMTIGEIFRESEALLERTKAERKDRAHFDYTQAMIIGRIVSVILSGKGDVPDIEECYEGIFTEEDIQARNERLSIERFKAFAAAHNAKIGEK